MARPKQPRRVYFEPNATYFKPRGIPLSQLKEICLSVEEFEALRLSECQNIEQKRCAEIMGISQPTFSRILTEARKKVAKGLVDGCAIKIDGGVFKMPGQDGTGPSGRGFGRGRGFGGPTKCRCPVCGNEQPHIRGQPCAQMKCEKCGSLMVRGE